ncbi:MAG: T9SS type A sorting domain-containing protein, partial [Bacteroidales bacterium]|nr:T9SS type A sorting domain-containing protein [Bacteroidales bacterium]MCF8456338.1 T9SS type A sorting domain-containing protein [Bacteroidales bacterium]
SLNSKFIVTGNCTVGTNPGEQCPPGYLDYSTFEGFDIAIRVFGSSTTNTAYISQCSFDKNARAIQIDGINNAVITRNYFKLGDCEVTGIPDPIPSEYGIKLLNCTGFMVEENKFEGVDNYINLPIGINPQQTNKGYSDNNQIYNNEFDKMSTALLPQGINKTDDVTGLQLLCNDFENTIITDIEVAFMLDDPVNQLAGIRFYQGNSAGLNNYSAANRFTDLAANPNLEYHYKYKTQGSIWYFYNDNDPAEEPIKFTEYKVIPKFAGVLENNCPSNIIDGAHFEMEPSKVSNVISKFNVGKTAYTNMYYAYLQEIDGGNTPLILQQIQSTWPQEAWDLRNDLMALAPYVSEDALLEAAFSGVLPDAMLFEICLANPDATRSDEFLRILREDIPNPLPLYMSNLIRENWDLETPRTILERGMASTSFIMDYNLNLLLTNEKLKAEPNADLLRSYHSQRDYLNDRYSIADSYIEEAKFDSSAIVLDQIPVDFDLDDPAIDEYDNYYLYHDLLQALNDSSRSIFDLDTTEIALLEQISNDNTGPSAIKSRNILCFAYGMCEEYPGNPGDTTQNKSVSFPGNPQQIINEAYTTLEVSPNPAKYYAEFSWEILNLEDEATLEIFDISGKLSTSHVISSDKGKWAWDTRDVTPGIYLYSIRMNDSQVANGKITVSK